MPTASPSAATSRISRRKSFRDAPKARARNPYALCLLLKCAGRFKPTDTDRGWTLEIAYPLTAFNSRQQVPPPVPGTIWRINFSRVEWKPGNPKEDNWVWSPQGVINMHVPDRWGYLHFR